MSLTKNSDKRIYSSAWTGMGMMAVVYFLLFAINLLLPLQTYQISFVMRLWGWMQYVLMLAAGLVWLRNKKKIRLKVILIGLILTLLCGLTNFVQGINPLQSIISSALVFFCFVSGDLLFQNMAEKRVVHAFSSSPGLIGKSLLVGALLALPLAGLNNLYFYLNSSGISMQNVFVSAVEALRPGIAEEVIYRYFILALCFSFMGSKEPTHWQMVMAVFLAVVPHSLNHLPDLFLRNVWMGFVMLLLTSLLFGLPMALLQIKRDLESAIAFHWVIDFLRFLFGF